MNHGEVEAFRIQLEYDHEALAEPIGVQEDWCAVARFDHTPNSPSGHDIREEGIHLDLCGGDENDRRRGFPPVPVNHAPEFCKQFFEKNHDSLIRRYETQTGVPKHKRKVF